MKKILLIAAVALWAMSCCCKKADKGECAKECCPKTECVEKKCCKADSCCAEKAACTTPCEKADSCCAAKAECPAQVAE